MLRPDRTKSSSPNSDRSRASVLLIAGWLTRSRVAAAETLRSAISASNATIRLRSIRCKSMQAIYDINLVYW